jgi:hypothetical protein
MMPFSEASHAGSGLEPDELMATCCWRQADCSCPIAPLPQRCTLLRLPQQLLPVSKSGTAALLRQLVVAQCCPLLLLLLCCCAVADAAERAAVQFPVPAAAAVATISTVLAARS